MKILMINKFLYPNGGSETYIFKLGKALASLGNEVQYFGMEHSDRCVGNSAGAYTANMDFHGGSVLSKLSYPVRTIYSSEARKKIRMVMDDFKPNVCHLNNFNYQLTPSIILEIRKWERENGRKVKIVYTAHDYQLVCPNHMMYNHNTHECCEKCAHGKPLNCAKGKCIHGSAVKSAVGSAETIFWKLKGTYEQIDTIICPTKFMKLKLDSSPVLASKSVVMLNFVDKSVWKSVKKKDYILYFGRFSEEKGIKTLVSVCKELPEIQFVFAGSGALESEIKIAKNIRNAGFQTGEALEKLIREARFTVYPSEWYENCPLSVMESLSYGTPVLAADIGGIPELVTAGETGELFKSGNKDELKNQIQKLWGNKVLTDAYSKNCENIIFDTAEQYCGKLVNIYGS